MPRVEHAKDIITFLYVDNPNNKKPNVSLTKTGDIRTSFVRCGVTKTKKSYVLTSKWITSRLLVLLYFT